MPNVLSPATSPNSELASAERSRRWPAKLLRGLAVLLILTGGLTLIDGVTTLLWQEPITALYASLRQDHLRSALHTVEAATPTAAEQRTLSALGDERRRIAFLATQLEHHAGDGGAVGRIVIPRISASFVVVKGTDTGDLKSGPGIYPETGFPGVSQTTAIAGHRTTYLAPFRHIDALSPGDHIMLYMPYAHFTYTVVGQRVVAPTDVEAAVGNVGYTRLVLSACTPLFSAAKRLLVYAHLTRTVPVGAARWLSGGVLPRPIEPVLAPTRTRALPPMLESLDPNRVAPLV
jgi:sortase A